MDYNQYDAFQKMIRELAFEASKQTFPDESQFLELRNSIVELVNAMKKIPQNLRAEAQCYASAVLFKGMLENNLL